MQPGPAALSFTVGHIDIFYMRSHDQALHSLIAHFDLHSTVCLYNAYMCSHFVTFADESDLAVTSFSVDGTVGPGLATDFTLIMDIIVGTGQAIGMCVWMDFGMISLHVMVS